MVCLRTAFARSALECGALRAALQGAARIGIHTSSMGRLPSLASARGQAWSTIWLAPSCRAQFAQQ
jgi:hypothetical protein